MTKLNCYPRYSYIIFLCISITSTIMSTFPLYLWTNSESSIPFVWSALMLLFTIIMFYAFLYHKQYIFIKNDKITLKNCFGCITQIEIKNGFYEIQSLPTFFSWASTIETKWICIYEDNSIPKFTSGCSNKKKYKRIQIIYNKENLDIIEKCFKS